MEYRGWNISLNIKPIPDRSHDIEAVHPDYDGCDGGNGLYITAYSVEEAKILIDEIEYERG